MSDAKSNAMKRVGRGTAWAFFASLPPASHQPFSHCTVLAPCFPVKESGICWGPGATGKCRASQTPLAATCVEFLRPLPGKKGKDLSPSTCHAPWAQEQHPRTDGTKAPGDCKWSASYRTSSLASLACQPCPVLMPSAPSASLSGIMLMGAHGTLCPSLGGEGVAIRNEKQGPGRCPALF